MFHTQSGKAQRQWGLGGIVALRGTTRNRSCADVRLVGRSWSSSSRATDAGSLSGSSWRTALRQRRLSSRSSAWAASQNRPGMTS